MALFIGAMSGTSLDGVDAVLVETALDDPAAALVERGFVHLPMPAPLRAELLELNRPGDNEVHRSALAANALARLYADAVARLLSAADMPATRVQAIGAHGQTVRHRPGEFDGTGYTVQVLGGALLAELSGIDVVCDLRSRDVAAGGQGAPLVPAFHAACFSSSEEDVAVLNLGGIGNLTLLPVGGAVRGFDCGPGNVLMDLWCQQRWGLSHDAGGARASRGIVDAALLTNALADPYFARQPPKSTGRDLFDPAWLARWTVGTARSDEDILATLAELTARSAIDAMQQWAPRTTRLLVCGGGAFNAHLLRRLAALAGPAVAVTTTASAGIAPDKVEALAFAWLAREFSARRRGSLQTVTGARGARLLGALYPA